MTNGQRSKLEKLLETINLPLPTACKPPQTFFADQWVFCAKSVSKYLSTFAALSLMMREEFAKSVND